MIYSKLILGAIVVLFIIYYIMMIGQLIGIWKVTDAEIKFNKLIIPFFYWMV